MAGESSKAASPPLLDKPWREINWRQTALQDVNNYRPFVEGQQIRILLYGPLGGGRTSFIYSVQSTLRGRMCVSSLDDDIFGGCFIKGYTTYKVIKRSPETFHPFVLNDISQDRGVLMDDIKLVFKGHVKDGYRFNPESKLSAGDPFYNEAPTANDRVHVLVCVVPADKLPCMKAEVKKKIRDVRVEASRLGIPQVAVLTKVDMACPEVKKDLKNVYRSKYLKEKMEQFSADVGIPMNCIFPVKNYNEEINLNEDVDSLILSALKHIIDFGDNCINRRIHNV